MESDHKDIIISQLKAELFEMKKGQRGYDVVFERLRDTEAHYFDLLRELVSAVFAELTPRTT